MADQIVTRQDLVDAHYDAETLGEFINGEENTEVTSRLGRTYWTLATINYLISQGQLKISDLQAAIDIAAAAGAGANGWTADLIVDGAETQKQINKKTVTHVECIADLINITNVWDGRTVYVKSVLKPIYGVALPFIAGGNFVYKASSTMQADGFLVVNAPNGRWIKALDESEITVDDFGGIGGNTKDNSDAFNAYASSPHVGMEIKLGKQGRYRVAKQVDLQGKNLVGSGMGKPNDKYYNLSSIDVDGSSPDLQGKTAFINCGPVIKNLTARCSNGAGKQVSFIEVDGYLISINNICIVNFYDQIIVKEATVGFYIDGWWSYYSQNSGMHCLDPNNRVSTTGMIRNVYFQLGDNYALIFNKSIVGMNFDNITLESMNGGIKCPSIARCKISNFWCENTKDGSAKKIFDIGTSLGNSWGNVAENIITTGSNGTWIDNFSPSKAPENTDMTGVVISNSMLSVSSSGATVNNKTTLKSTGLFTDGVLYESRLSGTAPMVKARAIGADGSGALYVALDTYTKLSRKWGTYNHGSNNAGAFYAPMMLTYDQSFSTPQINNGWQIVKESTGIYRVERVSGNTSVITNGHILVSGIIVGARLGTGASLSNGIQMIETYTGSWTNFTEAAGFKVFFRDTSGVLADPWRFTVAFTATS